MGDAVVSPVLASGAERWLHLLLDASVKGAFFLVAVALLELCWRRAGAAARHLVWTIGLLTVLVLPVLLVTVPEWRVPIIAPSSGSSSPWQSASVAATEAGGAPGAPVPAPARTIPLTTAVLIVWLAGAGIVAGRVGIGMVAICWMARFRAHAAPTRWAALSERLSDEIGLTRSVALLTCRRATVPMTWGPLRPVVLIPAEAETWTDDRRRVVLLHELAHVKRHDCLTQLAAQTACAIFWFHPLVWYAAGRMAMERERSCDDLVLTAGTKASFYAEELVEIVRTLRPAPAAGTAVVSMGRRSLIEDRVLAILDPVRSRSVPGARGSALALACLVLLAIPLAAMRPAPRADHSSPDRAAAAGASLSGSEVRALIMQAMKHLDNRDWRAAIEAFEAASGGSPHDGRILFGLGYSQLAFGSYDQGIETYQRALRIGLRPSLAMYNLACAHALKGDKEAALGWLERAVASGFAGDQYIKTDRDLNSLRGDPRFRGILERFPEK